MSDADTGGYRTLWSAVVLQALEDLKNEPLGSVDYNAAEAFFIGGGEWREGRANVANFLDVDESRLRAVGQAAIEARWREEGRDRPGYTPPVRREVRYLTPIASAEPAREHAEAKAKQRPGKPTHRVYCPAQAAHRPVSAAPGTRERAASLPYRWKPADGNPFSPHFRRPV